MRAWHSTVRRRMAAIAKPFSLDHLVKRVAVMLAAEA
jgi:hypothetical protein